MTRRLGFAATLLLLATARAHAGDGGAPAPREAPPPAAAWKTAPTLALARPTTLCTARRLGAWARLDCAPNHWVVRFTLLAGSPEGVILEADGSADDARAGARAIFPVAVGDRREFVLNRLSDRSSYEVEEEVLAVITETWIDGEPEPTLVVD